jgi:superfamily II DNA or RNA helicase
MKEFVNTVKTNNIIGLTATPPIDITKENLIYYTDLFGEIDYMNLTPEIIKEGLLSPFQDLVYFCEPTDTELEYLKNSHKKIKTIISEYSENNSDF